MRPPYSGGVLRVALCAVLAAAISSIGAATAPAAERADASVFGGLGTWVDIYDGAGLRGSRANGAAHGCAAREDRLGRDGELRRVRRRRGSRSAGPARRRAPRARNPRGRVVPARARQAGARQRRALAMLTFRTPRGAAFDGVALNIESTRLKNTALRSQRAVALTRELREAAGDTPLAIVPFNPRGLERRPSTWPRFPWAELAESADAFAPMIYTGGAYTGFDATYGYVTRALRLLRANTASPTSRSTSREESRIGSAPRSSQASPLRSRTTGRRSASACTTG